MGDFDFPNLTVQGRLVPEESSEATTGMGGPPQQAADAFELGVEIRGVWVPFYRRRSAVGLLADIERLEMQQPAQPQQPAPQPQPVPEQQQPAQGDQPPQAPSAPTGP